MNIEDPTGGLMMLMMEGANYKTNMTSHYVAMKDNHSNTEILIQRVADTCWIEAIIISKKYNIDAIKSITLKIGRGHFEIPFSVLRNVTKIIQNETTTMILVPRELFFKKDISLIGSNIPLLCLYSLDTIICFNLNSTIPIEYDLAISKNFYDQVPRRSIADNNEIVPMNNIHKFDLSRNTKFRVVNGIIDGVISGFFLETHAKPKGICISINGHTLFHYDGDMFGLFCEKINDWTFTKKHSKKLKKYLFKNNADIYIYDLIKSHIEEDYFYWIPLHKKEPWNSHEMTGHLNADRCDFFEIELFGCDGTAYCSSYFPFKLGGGNLVKDTIV